MKYTVRVCMARVCEDCGSKDLLKDAMRRAEKRPHVTVERRYCMGLCESAPNVQVLDEEGKQVALYSKVAPKEMQQIIEGL